MDFKCGVHTTSSPQLQFYTILDAIPSPPPACAGRALWLSQGRRSPSLEVMAEAIDVIRTRLARTRLSITTIKVPIDRSAEVIGPRGAKMINSMHRGDRRARSPLRTTARCSSVPNGEASQAAIDKINAISNNADAQERRGGFHTQLVKTTDFGARVAAPGAAMDWCMTFQTRSGKRSRRSKTS